MSSQELAWAMALASNARLSNALVQPPLCERAESTLPRPDWTHVGLSIVLVQRDRYLGRRTRFKVVAFPFVGEDEARWLLDLPVFAAGDIFVSFRREHAGAPLAAGLEIDLGEERPEPSGAEPAHHMLGLGPGFPDEDSRRIKGSLQDQRMAVSRLDGRPGHPFEDARPSGPDAGVERCPFRIEPMGQRQQAAAAVRPDFHHHDGCTLLPLGSEREDDPVRTDDFEIGAEMSCKTVAALLVDFASIDLDMLRNPARRREQPRAHGVGIKPGVEHPFRRSGEAA